jgi:hypothetical protein
MLSVDGVVDALRSGSSWVDAAVRLAVSAGYGVVLLLLAGKAMRRAVDR